MFSLLRKIIGRISQKAWPSALAKISDIQKVTVQPTQSNSKARELARSCRPGVLAILEAEAGGLRVQDLPRLQRKFKMTLES